MSTLFDPAYANDGVIDASLPPAAATRAAVVKCSGCRGAIDATVALLLTAAPAHAEHPRHGLPVSLYSCSQAACVAAVAQDLAAAIVGPLI